MTLFILKAQALQIAKCVGELCVVLKGDCDAIILTGGVAHSKMLMDMVIEYVGFLAPVYVYPGENEMEALVFWAAMYIYSLAALVSPGVFQAVPLYGAVSVLLALGTLALGAA